MPSAAATKRTNGNPVPSTTSTRSAEAYYERISKFDMALLWKVMKSVVTNEPATRCVPVIWHFN